MITNPIIPIWLMVIICIILLIVIIYKGNIKQSIIKILIVILLFIVNLRFMVVSDNSEIFANDLDVVFAIDNSVSMNANDYSGKKTRLFAIKKDCEFIINKLSGARFSVITFDNESNINIPLTTDSSTARSSIKTINTKTYYNASGSSLNTPIKNIENILESSRKDEHKITVLFFISDGEITDESKLKSYESLKELVDTGAVLGYGTTEGASMKVRESRFKEDEKTLEYHGEVAISKIDEDNLKQIADDLDIDYIHMEKQSLINKKLDEIIKKASSNLKKNNQLSYDDTYFYFLIPLFILLLIEAFNIWRIKL